MDITRGLKGNMPLFLADLTFFCPNTLTKSMKSLGEIEEELAKNAEPVLGFKPSSKFKRGPIGILIYVICGIIVFIPLRSAGVF